MIALGRGSPNSSGKASLRRTGCSAGDALMIFAGHRLSRDIDGVIDDPQSLALLSPETTDVYETIRRIGPTRIV